MKDTIITARRKKTEMITLLICFVLANVANLYSIIAYKTPAIEMLTSLGYVVVGTGVIYVLWGVIRLLFYGIKALFAPKSTTR